MTDKQQLEQPVQKNHYGKLEYWERRYQENTKQFDWYQKFEGVKDIITQYITVKSRILNAGCGNSTLSEDMFKEKYVNITNIDQSKVVIYQMQQQFKDFPQTFKYENADVRELPYADESFDCVIDKGLLDSVLCSEYSSQNSKKMLNNIHRVLTHKGIYILISYGQPKYRLPYLEKSTFDWAVTHYKIYKPDVVTQNLNFKIDDPDNYHYIYICRRGTQKQGIGHQIYQ